ncbi:MAG: T9SS type A sorting domain-containing protein [Bacteroidia bacterium]|jgi:hypothetical protein
MKYPNYFTFISYFLLSSLLFTADLSAQIMQKDPAEGFKRMLTPPGGNQTVESLRSAAMQFSSTLPAEHKYGKSFGGGYTYRGPFALGGRTRSIAVDITNENTWIVGSATGGIWRTTDAGANWNFCYDTSATLSITWVTQDTRSGKTNNWYAGTGEMNGADFEKPIFFSGNGILKSTDNGLHWNHLNSTNTSPGGIYNSWSAVHRVIPNPVIDSLDVVFAATFDGVWRSIDGGKTFIRRRGAGATTGVFSYWTDVAVTANGVVYAALSSGGTNAGIWRSPDNGSSWVNISPPFFTTKTGRIVIATVPSDTNQLYFAVNYTDSLEHTGIWKYVYVSGNGSGTGGRWENRSGQIPAISGYGTYNSLQGNCMHLSVHPSDSQLLFLGGNNLYRSTDGFSTTEKTTLIGGVDSITGKAIAAHHSNNYQVHFFASDSLKMLSVHDAGISITQNALDSQVVWESRNNTYATTSVYSVTMDHSSTSRHLLSGAREQGVLFTRRDSTTLPWNNLMKGHGTQTVLNAGSTECYAAMSHGILYRILLDSLGDATQFAQLTPETNDSALFLPMTPFVADANLYSRIFTLKGNSIWRNQDVTTIPLYLHPDSTHATALNWTELTQARLNDTAGVYTALFSSKLQKNFIYAGTDQGKLYRIINTDSAETVYDITGTNFPKAYIQCIVQHPKNANRLFVVFSNYGVLSIFYSSDGGSTWNPVSGNLEQNPDGSGFGPACLWLAIANIRNIDIYYVGTTTGLYATKILGGTATTWTRQAPESIGYSIVTHMEHRALDGMFAISTLGAGVYTAYVQSLNESVSEEDLIQAKITAFPVPVKDFLRFDPEQPASTYTIFDLQGRTVHSGTMLNNAINTSALNPGMYVLQLQQADAKLALRFVKE